MTLEQADVVLKYKTKLNNYNVNRTFSMSPAEVAELDAVAWAVLNTGTNWYCATCCIDRVAGLVAMAEAAYADYSKTINDYNCAQ